MQYWSDLKPSLSWMYLNLPSRSKTRKWTKKENVRGFASEEETRSDGGSEGLLGFHLDHISQLVSVTQ